MLNFTENLQVSRNRFDFAQQMNSCVHPRLKEDWAQYGGKSFRFDVLESIAKKKDQTDSDFNEDLKALFEMSAKGAEPDKYE